MSPFSKLPALLAVCLFAGGGASAESLLKSYPLEGDVKTTYWTFLASQNPYRIPDSPTTMKGTMSVASPGYGASMGLYSWTGAYSMAVNYPATATPAAGIRQVVYQLDVTWDPATTFPVSGGPKLSYNGGNQQIAATLPVIVDGTRVVENETGVPEMGDIDAFTYRGITWQWDLSGFSGAITSVKIDMPFANHTSVVGARIDVASQFVELGGPPPTPLQQWRQDHFRTMENSGLAADDADYDSDGIPNLVEYGLGCNPASAAGLDGPAAKPVPLVAANQLSLCFSIPATPPESLVYQVQVSGNLTGWQTLATKAGTQPWIWSGDGASKITTSPVGARSQVTVGDNGSPATKRMMRLKVTY